MIAGVIITGGYSLHPTHCYFVPRLGRFYFITQLYEWNTNKLNSTAAVSRESNYSRLLQKRSTTRRVETTVCVLQPPATTNGSAAANTEKCRLYYRRTMTMTTRTLTEHTCTHILWLVV